MIINLNYDVCHALNDYFSCEIVNFYLHFAELRNVFATGEAIHQTSCSSRWAVCAQRAFEYNIACILHKLYCSGCQLAWICVKLQQWQCSFPLGNLVAIDGNEYHQKVYYNHILSELQSNHTFSMKWIAFAWKSWWIDLAKFND